MVSYTLSRNLSTKSLSPVVWDKAVFGTSNGKGSVLTKGFYSKFCKRLVKIESSPVFERKNKITCFQANHVYVLLYFAGGRKFVSFSKCLNF
jgi:hypothetical protein